MTTYHIRVNESHVQCPALGQVAKRNGAVLKQLHFIGDRVGGGTAGKPDQWLQHRESHPIGDGVPKRMCEQVAQSSHDKSVQHCVFPAGKPAEGVHNALLNCSLVVDGVPCQVTQRRRTRQRRFAIAFILDQVAEHR